MIFINSLTGYLVIKWTIQDPKFIESLIHKFPDIPGLWTCALLESSKGTFWDADYYQTSYVKQLIRQKGL